MVDLVRKFPDKKSRPRFLQWNGLHIQTSDHISLPREGWLAAKFVDCDEEFQQGFDLKLSKGWLRLANGQHVQHLRTWFDSRLARQVQYEFETTDGILQFWNVYKRKWPDGGVTEERMTGNAGFWVEEVAETRRIYHCSSGECYPPNFEAMVIELSWFSDSSPPSTPGREK